VNYESSKKGDDKDDDPLDQMTPRAGRALVGGLNVSYLNVFGDYHTRFFPLVRALLRVA
jgi:hypothetical protein